MNVSKLGVLGVGIVAALGVATPGFTGGNKSGPVPETRDCGNGNHVDWLGATTLWPPNHKFQSSTITAVGANDTDLVTLAITPSVLDATGGDGGAEHDPDWMYDDAPHDGQGSASQDLSLRAERSGKGDGREYTVDWSATFNGTQCTSTDGSHEPFIVTVPHDMGQGNDN